MVNVEISYERVVEEMILGDVLQFVLEQNYLGQVIRNVFGYVVSVADPAASLTEVATLVQVEIGDIYLGIQVPGVSGVQTSLRNLDNPDDFIEIDWTGIGTDVAPGPGMPSYVAAAFKLLRGDVDTRNGSKRFTGIGEDFVTDNTWLAVGNPNVLTVQDALAATLFVTPSIMEIEPVIIGRDPITGLPDTGRIAPILEAQAQEIISTQNSRKAGRGE